jgi:PAS domain S-box-containing protein
MPPGDGGGPSIAENIPEGILIAPGFNGPVLYANRCATELTGYSIAELLQLGPAHLVPLEDYPRIRQRLEQPLSGKEVPESCQATLLRKDGRGTPVEFTGTPVVWQGRPAILFLVKDVSRYISKEEELKQRVLELKAKWQANSEALELHMEELATQKNNLDRTHRELVRTNTALSVLARNIDRRRQELEEKIALDVSAKILPAVNELRRDQLPARILAKLDVVAALLTALTPEGSKAHEVIAALTATELRVALMIKKGFSSDRIAVLLNTSPHTIKTHRRNIRKKLGVQNSKVNLSSYLKLKVSKDM